MVAPPHLGQCAVCGGALSGTRLSPFQHVPAPVCDACAERWSEEAVLQLDQLDLMTAMRYK
jgi:hypothetical protein